MNPDVSKFIRSELSETEHFGIDIHKAFIDLCIPDLVYITTIKNSLQEFRGKWDSTYDITCLIRDITLRGQTEENYVKQQAMITIQEIYKFFTIFFIHRSIKADLRYNIDKEYNNLIKRDDVILKRAIHLIENSLYISNELLIDFLKNTYITLNQDECSKTILKNNKDEWLTCEIDARIILGLLFDITLNLRICLDEDKIGISGISDIELLKIVATEDFINKFNTIFDTCY